MALAFFGHLLFLRRSSLDSVCGGSPAPNYLPTRRRGKFVACVVDLSKKRSPNRRWGIFKINKAIGSSCSLVVGDAFRLGRSGALGGKGKDDDGDDVGQHIVDAAGDLECFEEIEAGVDIAQCTAEAEEQCRPRDVLGLPLTEDHNGKCKEAEARNTVLKRPLADACGDIYDAAETAECAGDQNACPTHLVDIDADGVRRLGMLTASHKTQTEAGLVHHNGNEDEDYDGKRNEKVQLKAAEIDEECLPAFTVDDVGGGVACVLRGVYRLDDDRCCGNAEEVQCRTDYGLIRLEVYTCDRKQCRIRNTCRNSREDDQDDYEGGAAAGGQVLHNKCAAQCADDHDAFKTEVYDAGMLRDTAAECNEYQDGGEYQSVLDK